MGRVAHRRNRALLVCGMINFPVTFVMQATAGQEVPAGRGRIEFGGRRDIRAGYGRLLRSGRRLRGPALKLTGQRRKPVMSVPGMILRPAAAALRHAHSGAGVGVPGRLRAAGPIDRGYPVYLDDDEGGQPSGRCGGDDFRAQHRRVLGGRRPGQRAGTILDAFGGEATGHRGAFIRRPRMPRSSPVWPDWRCIHAGAVSRFRRLTGVR